ncbi:acetyltransferase [Kaistella daneshvariae]|uniref:Acetyltransferase n=1 Tax=Kaistella daneshvariae TaxID=2487074 RepID=A0ABM7C6M3_9FLAO|nr:acetyltransferase [Kaistella daneshvariae]AZI66620.1 acetyltransferase [Kaistella daneshvariae]
MEKVTIIGGGGHAKVLIDCLEQENKFHIENIVDDNPPALNILGFEIKFRDPLENYAGKKCLIAIGNAAIRRRIAQSLRADFVTTIHPSAIISPHATLGSGNQILAGTIINASAIVGNHCILNTGAIVEHDCRIGDFVHVSPRASMGGNVSIGEGTHIGIGATIIQNIHIGKNVIIGGGAVVISDIPDNCTAVGIPAKPIKFH